MWSDLRPFPALFDILFDVTPPANRQSLGLGFFRIIIQDVDVALKVADRNQLLLAVIIHIHHTEPAVGPAVMIAEFGLFAPADGVEDHHSIVRRYTDLRNAIAIKVMNDVQWLENGVFWRVRLTDETMRVQNC